MERRRRCGDQPLLDKSLLSEEEGGARAFPGDQREQWSSWQMCELMRRLKLDYPIDESRDSLFSAAGRMEAAILKN